MLPVSEDLSENYNEEKMPSLTWKLDNEKLSLCGTLDGIESVKQAIFCILSTERYESLIYEWDYGVELKELIGMPISYVLPELKRRIKEALEQDDRIISVNDFQFNTDKRGIVLADFTVETNYGAIDINMEVPI